MARSLVQQVRLFPVGQALRDNRGAMCLACGVDLAGGDVKAPCASCGTPNSLMPEGAPHGLVLGSLHPRRSGLRKRPAMLVGRGANEFVLLLHNGQTLSGPLDDLPVATDSGVGQTAPTLRSPVGQIFRNAAAVIGGASLPWSADLLLHHAFGALNSMPWARRAAAQDVLELGRPDLLGACGLTGTETTWLGLVYSARHGDAAGVIAAVAALPPDRYRRKIAVVAALLGQVRQVPGAAERLAPALLAFAETEPLAAIAQRALGLSACTPRQRIDDQTARADTFSLPIEIAQLPAGFGTSEVGAGSRALLGARGRLALLHTAEPDPGSTTTVALRDAPLSVVDDLIDAGKVTDVAAACADLPAEKAYLTARLAPERLSDAQVEQVGHRDEAIRRRLLAGDTDLADDDADRPMARHVASVGQVLHRRPQDLVADHVLPEHREVARRLADLITRADLGEEPAPLLTGPVLDDRSTWLPLVRLFGAERLRGADGQLVRRFSDFFEWLDLIAAREHLFLADWRQATAAARRCLELATAEAVRDEAQNLLACGLHNLGDHGGAMRELEQAIEGTYSVALLANIGVVAAHLDPELAASQLSRIVREGPTIAMRVNAVRQALAIWRSDGKLWAGDGADRRTLPTVLREPLRSIVVEPIGLDEFRVIAAALATYDAAWLTARNSLRGSPHRTTIEARYYLAVAAEDGFTSVVDVLATIGDWASAPPWLSAARDELVQQTIEFLVDHLDDPDNTAGVIAHALVTKVRGLPERDQLMLVFLAVATLAYHLTEQDRELGDGLIDLFRSYEGRTGEIATEQREAVDELRELCVRRITFNLAAARQQEINALTDVYNAALDVLNQVQRGSALWFRARGQVAEAVDACQRAKAQLRPWLRELEKPDQREMIMDFLDDCADFELKAQQVLGS